MKRKSEDVLGIMVGVICGILAFLIAHILLTMSGCSVVDVTDAGDAATDTETDIEGIWTDPRTGLQWEVDAGAVPYTYAEAEAHCSGLELGGGGWELPRIQDLIRLARGCNDGDASDPFADSRCQLRDPDCLEESEACWGRCGACPLDSYMVRDLPGGQATYWSRTSALEQTHLTFSYMDGSPWLSHDSWTAGGRCKRCGL